MTSISQAKKIFEICVKYARRGKKITYGQVLSSLGYKKGVSGYAIRYGLELLWITCSHSKIPILTSIVVNNNTHEPTTSGFNIENWEEEVKKVYEFEEWPKAGKIDWDYVWKNRKKLSDEYGTRGYWGGR
jgi:hypothetical protein